MLENCKTAQERWGGRSDMIDRWLADRQAILIKFFDLKETHDQSTIAALLNRFCEELVDYLSKGHFEIYEQLFSEAKEFNDGGIELAEAVYPKIEVTTSRIMVFNDRYLATDNVLANSEGLKTDLSVLGENLAERFDLEDQLIESLHTVHKEAAEA